MDKVVVIIDDDLDDVEFLKESIQVIHPSTLCVAFSNPWDAVQKISSKEFPFSPDYIFIDFNMPMMNGGECLKELRGVKRLSQTKFVLNSTSMPDMLADALRKEGADVTFQKPYRVESYEQILCEILNFKSSPTLFSSC